MKKLLLLFWWLLTGLSFQTHGGNILGGDLTYTCVAPGVYHVRFRMVQDCSPVVPAPFVNLQLSSTGCSAPNRTVALNRGQLHPQALIQDYCPNAATPNCAPFNQPGNGFWVEYAGLINFSVAEQACANWTLGVLVDTDTRSATANLVGAAPFYLEALVRLGANNNSVEYSPLNIPYGKVLVNRPAQYALNAAEVDGDSLVYSLRPAMLAPASPVTYQAPYTFQLPVGSSPPATLSPFGDFRFTPNVYVPNTAPTQGQNRYATVFQIDEYRKLNGAMQFVGSSQRNMLFEVVVPDTVTNKKPFLTGFTANGQSFDPSVPLVLQAGQPVTVIFQASDPDSADLVRVDLDSMALTSIGLVRTKILNAFNRPQIELVFNPGNNHVRANPYYLPVRAEDNGCPIRKITTDVLAFEVRGTLGIGPEPVFKTGFKAYPNPFTNEVSFQFAPEAKATTIVICDLLGRETDRFAVNDPGAGKTIWKNAAKQAPGTYLARLISGNRIIQTLKFTKLK